MKLLFCFFKENNLVKARIPIRGYTTEFRLISLFTGVGTTVADYEWALIRLISLTCLQKKISSKKYV